MLLRPLRIWTPRRLSHDHDQPTHIVVKEERVAASWVPCHARQGAAMGRVKQAMEEPVPFDALVDYARPAEGQGRTHAMLSGKKKEKEVEEGQGSEGVTMSGVLPSCRGGTDPYRIGTVFDRNYFPPRAPARSGSFALSP